MDRDLDNEYYIREDIATRASRDLLCAVQEAYELSRVSMEEKSELKELREERKQYDKKIEDLNSIISENQKNFMKILADQLNKIAAERDEAKRLHADALAERDMWKKSYEDLTKCL